MAANSSTGETASNYLEKITPKDLVMFSPATRKQIAKNDFDYLNPGDHDMDTSKDPDSIRVWGLPYLSPTSPGFVGVFGGLTVGAFINYAKKRPPLTSIHVHLLSSLAIGLSVKFAYDQIDKYKVERELVIWDYVKRNPQDFPEVFNPPKTYADLLLPWRRSR